MSTLADASTRAALRQRIERLIPESPRRWGRMTPHQMVCHLNDAYRMADGSRMPKPMDNFVSRSLIKFVALHTSMKWPAGAKTVPEADQEQGGTRPIEWSKDVADLVRFIETFNPPPGHPHPFFGSLTLTEWSVWGYRHTDHHLRQFGV